MRFLFVRFAPGCQASFRRLPERRSGWRQAELCSAESRNDADPAQMFMNPLFSPWSSSVEFKHLIGREPIQSCRKSRYALNLYLIFIRWDERQSRFLMPGAPNQRGIEILRGASQ